MSIFQPLVTLYPQQAVYIRYSRRRPENFDTIKIKTNISSAYENLAIFSRRKLVIFLNHRI